MELTYASRVETIMLQVNTLAEQHPDIFVDGYKLGPKSHYERTGKMQRVYFHDTPVGTLRDGVFLRTVVRHISYEELSELENGVAVATLSLNGHSSIQKSS